MYLDFYGLKDPPFSITPDPRFVFLSERHRDALAHLLYGVGQGGGGGFVQLTGEVGTGKTTLCRLLLEQLPENTRVALVLNPRLNPVELLETICEELKLEVEGKRGSAKALVDCLNHYLLDAYAQGLRVVLIVDEAQNLSVDALEQIRLLTNLETATQKLLQIILLGQPELRELLGRAELRQLAQRITARYHLMPLDETETEAYLHHRLAVAGAQRFPFTRLAVRAIYKRTGGVPRLINVVSERALLAGYAQNQNPVGERLVDQAADEALASSGRPGWVRPVIAAALALGLGAGAWAGFVGLRPEPATDVAETDPPVESKGDSDRSGRSDEALQRFLALAGNSLNSESKALTKLLALWQVDVERVRVGDALRCPAVIVPGLNCLRASGTLRKLDLIDRPVMIRLQVAGDAVYALVTRLGKDSLSLELEGERVTLSHAQLADYWLGEFLAVWTSPEFLPGHVRRGESGPAVSWVRQRMAHVGDGDGGFGPDYFDAELEEQVRRLQLESGLTTDGIVGPETQLLLASRQSEGPRLSRRARATR